MPNLFSTIWNGYNNTLVQGAVQNVSAGLSAVAAIIQAVLGLYVLITGGMMLFGGMSFDVGIRRVVRSSSTRCGKASSKWWRTSRLKRLG